MTPAQDLFVIICELLEAAEADQDPKIVEPLTARRAAAETVGKSFSGSWLGYHSRVYYNDFQPAPAGDNFSQEWGLQVHPLRRGLSKISEWHEYTTEDVLERIASLSKGADLSEAVASSLKAKTVFDTCKDETITIFEAEIAETSDSFLTRLRDEINDDGYVSKSDVIARMNPNRQIMTHDTLAISQGPKLPPHFDVLAGLIALEAPFAACRRLAAVARKAASYLERRTKTLKKNELVGTNVFIGHGRSPVWRELKDFLASRLALTCDEFNSQSAAGLTITQRLGEMLDSAAFAFLIMTAEDELADGTVQARMNVIHEAGLFQGRLGFKKAILLVEEGCAQFSNVDGLVQIRFPTGDVSAKFEEIRHVLERERIIPPSRS